MRAPIRANDDSAVTWVATTIQGVCCHYIAKIQARAPAFIPEVTGEVTGENLFVCFSGLGRSFEHG
jgi:hypothetical protein